MNASQSEQEVTAESESGGCTAEAYLAVQTLDLLSAAVGQVLSLVVDGGEQQLGICQQGMCPLKVPPQLLLHIKVSVAHLKKINPALNDIISSFIFFSLNS